jgi:hypothetical protein
MQKGKSIVELAQEIQTRADNSQDYISDTREISMGYDGESISIGDELKLEVNELAHGQIAERTGIPKKYYEIMRNEAPELLATNVNTWFHDKPKRRMVRTTDNTARAFLSDRYKRIDNNVIAEAALPALLDSSSQFDIVSSEITDKHMYIQARLPRVEGEVKKGDAVQAGLIIRNSEVGLGCVTIDPMIYRLVCTNGLVVGSSIADARVRKTHLGSQVPNDEHIEYQASTIEAMDRALMQQIRDTIMQLSSPEQFMILMDKMRAAAETQPVTNPIKAVEVMAKTLALPMKNNDSIIESLIRGQDYSKWGMLNAITEQANTIDNYDHSVDLEVIGGKVLTMPDSQWSRIAEAA